MKKFALLTTLLSYILLFIFLAQCVMSIIGKQLFSSQSIALTCCALVALIALANIVIAIAEQDGSLTIIYPAILMVGIVLSLFFKTMQTNIFYLIVMTCVSACLTVANQEQLEGYK